MIKINYRYIFLLVISYFFAYSQGGPVPFTLFFLVLFMGLVSLIASIALLIALKLHLKIPHVECSSGDVRVIKYVFRNRSLLFMPYIILNSEVLIKLIKAYNGEIISLKPKEEAILRYKVTFPIRGIYNLGNCSTTIRDALGIVEVKRNYHLKSFIKVYPRIYSLNRIQISGKDFFEVLKKARRKVEDSYVVKDIRKYIEGDSIKKINWKISAKKQEFYVKNMEYVSGQEFFLLLDMHQRNNNLDSKGIGEEMMVDLAASLAKAMLQNSIDVRLSINNDNPADFVITREHDFDRLMEYLLVEKSKASKSFIDLLYEREEYYSGIYGMGIITARATSELIDYCVSCKPREKTMVLFVVEETEELLYNKELLGAYGVSYYNIKSLISEPEFMSLVR